MWRSVHIAFNITPPNSINTLFGTWLDGIDSDTARHIRVGVLLCYGQSGTAEMIWSLTEQ